MLHGTLKCDHIQWYPQLIGYSFTRDLFTEHDLITELDLFTESLPYKIYNGCGIPVENAFSSESWSYLSWELLIF